MIYIVSIVLLILALLFCRWYRQAVAEDPTGFGKGIKPEPKQVEEVVINFDPPYIREIYSSTTGAKLEVATSSQLPADACKPRRAPRPLRRYMLTDAEIVAQFGPWDKPKDD